ncbi:hypothetical protein B9Z55_015285 [Caenorhabditis nigoni]|uniref:P-type domain-containing protein n=2 Tax=Caenorhabditis nigoni TaxID=1611254 RepID=A0A2G5U9T0_9PELO|nr:hypothetical protein B9Z55_015285 [Caenorhabditis nigoni]
MAKMAENQLKNMIDRYLMTLTKGALLLFVLCLGAHGESVDVSKRVDCFPEPGASQGSCQSRGCIWEEAPNGSPTGTPWCYYPTESGFTVQSTGTNSFVLAAKTRLGEQSAFVGNEIQNTRISRKKWAERCRTQSIVARGTREVSAAAKNDYPAAAIEENCFRVEFVPAPLISNCTSSEKILQNVKVFLPSSPTPVLNF